MRGLDYYSKTVFEWVTDKLGAQGTVCAGGRYDALVKQLGGRETPAVGFAMGMERLLELVENEHLKKQLKHPHAAMLMMGERAQRAGFALTEQLRDQMADVRIFNVCGGSFKSQMKRADKSRAEIAIILGDDELDNNIVTIKFLRESNDDVQQKQVTQQQLIEILNNTITKAP